ncbi:MAG: TonB-dependent receptor plug domain-containing protein [Saprospiraceae bacterium]|nr:TonB-dependent receptor plug domain-containing protein [Saprospiraceae bacterium]
MRPYLRLLFVLPFYCLLRTTSAQVDTSLLLPTLEVRQTQLRNGSVGSQNANWSTEQLKRRAFQNLTSLLEQEAGLYIKSYGLGSLATSSIRGGSAGHTLVLWNGLPIQSPMLGLLDLSLLPIQSVDRVSVQRGGNTALWGSGAVGGIISLDNQTQFEKGIGFSGQTSFGSFDDFQQRFDLSVGNKMWQSRTRFSYQEASNDFYYDIAPGFPQRQQTNAALLQQNFNQDIYWKPNNKQQIALHYWRQFSDRQIPPANTQNRSEAYQIDRADRLVLDWQQVKDSYVLRAKLAGFDEDLQYFDPQIKLSSPSHFSSLIGELSGQWYGKNGYQILTGYTQTYNQAESNGYQTEERENRSALFASVKQHKAKWQWQISLRQTLVDGEFIPLVPTVAIDYRVFPTLIFKGKVSRNYRLPTLNDRFWQPGGNPGLNAESGWSEELTIEGGWGRNTLKIRGSVTGFNRQIDNWILWSIRTGQSFWSANNIAAVWSRGLEPRLNISYQLSQLGIKLQLGYDYVRSTNQIALENPRIAKGQQLLYTPVHQGFGNLQLDWQSLRLNYNHRLVGPSQGINDPLTAFDVGQVNLQYQLSEEKAESHLFFQVNNIWNRSYLIVERRPMPGANYQIGIKLSYYNKEL